MKGKTLVIGIILFVVLIVGGIYFAMTATINKIKEEGPGDSEEAYALAELVPNGCSDADFLKNI